MNEVEKLIIERLSEFVSLIQVDDFLFEVDKSSVIEVRAIRSREGERICLLKLEVRESNHAICIPNIFLPPELMYMGLGKRMVWLIFSIGGHFGYSTFLTMLTDTFKQKMLLRGAILTDEYDKLQIVNGTDLSSKTDPNNNLYFRIHNC